MVTRRCTIPSSSSRLIRRQQGLDDSPTRSAISATERLAAGWIRSRMRASTESRTSDKFFPPFHAILYGNCQSSPKHGHGFGWAHARLICSCEPSRKGGGKEIAMRHSEVTLDAKFLLEDGRVFIPGVQALIRVMLDRRRLDVRDGLNTAGFVSGYRGSPLGGLDQQAHRAGKLLPPTRSCSR